MKLAQSIAAAVSAEIAKLWKAAPAVESTEADPGAITEELRAFIKSETADHLAKASETMQKANESLAKAHNELNERNATISRQEQEIASLKAESEKKDKEITDLKATIADPKGKIEELASIKAREMAASQGVPALKAEPSATPANPSAKRSDLKGRNRVIAAFEAKPLSN